MIRQDLVELQYYLNRLSKFMQESYGINEQVETYFSLLDQVNSYYDQFFDQLDFMNINSSINPEGEMLDHIGAIFGCRRSFTIPIYSADDPYEIEDYEHVDLNNDEYLIFIKTQVIKQNFDGTRGTLQKIYATYIDDEITSEHLIDLIFLYIMDPENPLHCHIYWDIDDPSENLKILFENGYLTIESLGIVYTRSAQNVHDISYYTEKSYPEEWTDPTEYPNTRFAIERFVLLSSKPSDWDSNYTQYYKISSTSTTSTWDEDNIYYINSTNKNKQAYKPLNWETGYSGYGIMEKNESSTYASNTYYKLERIAGGLYV